MPIYIYLYLEHTDTYTSPPTEVSYEHMLFADTFLGDYIVFNSTMNWVCAWSKTLLVNGNQNTKNSSKAIYIF